MWTKIVFCARTNMPEKKISKPVVKKADFSKALSALLLMGVITSCAAMFSACSDETADPAGTSGQPETAETAADTDYGEAPAWAQNVDLDKNRKTNKTSEKLREADAVSTMYADSFADAFGAVTKITLYAEDNPKLPYDVEAYKKSADSCFYLFLPSNLALDDIKVRALHSDGTETGVYTLNFESGTNYGVMVSENDYFEVIPKQSKLPSLMIQIDEDAGSIDRMNRDSAHNTTCYGDMTLVVSDELAREKGWDSEYVSRENDLDSVGTMEMRGRGNWTWSQNKKPYQLKLEKSSDLLGMGKAKTWLLLANVMDASLLRNQLFYDLGEAMGLEYSPDIEPVDVFLNGEYIGQYSLCEKVEVGENRVDIDDDKDFLLELDHYYFNETYTFITNNNKTFTLHNQETTDGVSQIRRIMNKIEEHIYDHDDETYADYIDVDSWVKYWWLQDLSRNNDTFIGSNYFYYVYDEGKLYAGPIWDMDNTLGIWGGGENLDPEHWHSDDRGWLKHLCQHDDFYNKLMDYYDEVAKDLFDTLPGKIDEYAEYIKESAEMNYIVNARELFVNTGTRTWEEDIEYLKDFLNKRLDWYYDEIG